MTISNGGPAFPTTKPLESWDDPNRGMMLRDFYAAQALIGLLAGGSVDTDPKNIADDAYAIADAMLEARKS